MIATSAITVMMERMLTYLHEKERAKQLSHCAAPAGIGVRLAIFLNDAGSVSSNNF